MIGSDSLGSLSVGVSFFTEPRQRSVLGAALLQVVAAWLVRQVAVGFPGARGRACGPAAGQRFFGSTISTGWPASAQARNPPSRWQTFGRPMRWTV